MKRRRSNPQDDHERWLVSYADFVTLLFAFFVVMFAHSTVDQEKVRSFAANFQKLVKSQEGNFAAAAGLTLPQPADALLGDALTMLEMQPAIERLEQELLPEIQEGKVELSLQPRGLIMSLRESGFFAPGEAKPQPQSLATMAKVAQALTRIPGEIRLEGHTDNTPINTYRFPSNWQLSTARAITVLKLLVNEYGISPQRLAAAGYGEHSPLVPNDTAENRARNRRVDVVILTREASEMEPDQASSAERSPVVPVRDG